MTAAGHREESLLQQAEEGRLLERCGGFGPTERAGARAGHSIAGSPGGCLDLVRRELGLRPWGKGLPAFLNLFSFSGVGPLSTYPRDPAPVPGSLSLLRGLVGTPVPNCAPPLLSLKTFLFSARLKYIHIFVFFFSHCEHF